MDRVFLRVLHNDPDRAPELFVHLFERGDALSVTRFLSDRGDLFDAAKVALSLPKAPFLKAAWQERVRL
jgi:lycopene beta-cyclase